MEFLRHFPLFSILIAFIGTVLCSLLPSKKSRLCAFVCEWICVGLGIGTLVYTLRNGSVIYQMGHLTRLEDGSAAYWFNNVIRFGVTEALLATVFPLILFFCILGGLRKLEEDVSEAKEKYYYVLSDLALVALIALVYADDVFTGYVFLEISTLASIGLIAVKDKGRTTVAAIRYMIFNLVGSGLFLIGIVLLYDLTGYFMLEKIQVALSESVANQNTLPAVTCSLALITVGLGIKSGLFPFYFWMADTYGESTTASAGIISGLISKGYLFLLMKFMLRGFGFFDGITGLGVADKTGMTVILFVLGVCGTVFGSVSALFEKRINKMIAYSSAAQIGYVYLAFGIGKAGMAAAVFQIIAHAITKPLLFISARGLIEVSDHRPQFRYLRGSGKRNVLAGIGFSVGAMSMIGFPATAGFMVKYLYLEAALGHGIPLTVLIFTILALVLSTLLNTGYLIHTVITVYSPATEPLPDVSDHKNRVGYVVSVLSLVLLNVLFGTLPILTDWMEIGVRSLGTLL